MEIWYRTCIEELQGYIYFLLVSELRIVICFKNREDIPEVGIDRDILPTDFQYLRKEAYHDINCAMSCAFCSGVRADTSGRAVP